VGVQCVCASNVCARHIRAVIVIGAGPRVRGYSRLLGTMEVVQDAFTQDGFLTIERALRARGTMCSYTIAAIPTNPRPGTAARFQWVSMCELILVQRPEPLRHDR
jgi:hypothetical protein